MKKKPIYYKIKRLEPIKKTINNQPSSRQINNPIDIDIEFVEGFVNIFYFRFHSFRNETGLIISCSWLYETNDNTIGTDEMILFFYELIFEILVESNELNELPSKEKIVSWLRMNDLFILNNL